MIVMKVEISPGVGGLQNIWVGQRTIQQTPEGFKSSLLASSSQNVNTRQKNNFCVYLSLDLMFTFLMLLVSVVFFFNLEGYLKGESP